MEFKKLTLSDKPFLYELYAKNKTLGTEYCFFTLFNWLKDNYVEIARGDDYIALRLTFRGKVYYFPPMTADKSRFSEVLDELEKSGATEFVEVTDAVIAEFCARNYQIEADRDMAEYVYLSEKLINLSGKALHGKRNHIAKFTSLYPDFEFAEYTEEHRAGVERLLQKWAAEKLPEMSDSNEFWISTSNERTVVLDVLSDLKANRCFADVLLVGGKVVGFSIGEILPTNVGAVYIEKADTAYEGAYSILNQLFAQKHFSGVKYVNRQEDLGDPGLRRAKLSYKPKKIFLKYIAKKSQNGDNFSDDTIELYRQSFPEDGEQTVNYFFKNVFSPDRYREIREEGTLAAALHVLLKDLRYLGKPVTLPFIAGVATAQYFRNKGYARRLIEQTLRCLKTQKHPFCALHPAIEGFYEKFGFEKVFRGIETQAEYQKQPTSDVELLNKIYNEVAEQHEVYIARDTDRTAQRLAQESGANLLYADGELIGYELFGEDQDQNRETAELVLLNDFKLAAEKGMARILDLRHAFALVNFKNAYKFRLTDCLLEENNAAFSIGPDGLSSSDGYDFELTERELVALFFGKPVKSAPKKFAEEFPKSVFFIDKY